MKLTLEHALFWASHSGPQWANAVLGTRSIHVLINAQTKRSKAYSLETTNTVSLVRSMRSLIGRVNEPEYASVSAYVRYISTSPHASIRRKATTKRWLKHMQVSP